MQTSRPLSAEELVRNVHSKLIKAGLDPSKYSRQLKDIASLFEPDRSRVELIATGPRVGNWDMFCYFKGIRHCFHSAREVAATFGIPIAQTDAQVKRKREDESPLGYERGHGGGPSGAGGGGGGGPGGTYGGGSAKDWGEDDVKPSWVEKTMMMGPPKKKTNNAVKKAGRMGSRFQNQKLVKAINANSGLEVSCGNLKARLVSANLGGMTFEMLDDAGRPTGDMVPPSQLAKRSCLAHQNNAWKSIKVDGITLDAWVTRLQDEMDAEDGVGGMGHGGQAAMRYMNAVDTGRSGGRKTRSGDDDDATADDDDEYVSGGESDGGFSDRERDGLKLLSGMAGMARMRGTGLQPAESGLGGAEGVSGPRDVPGAGAAEALLGLAQNQSQGAAAMSDDPAALRKELQQARDTILALTDENRDLRRKRDKLERLVAQKNSELAEASKSLNEARNDASGEQGAAQRVREAMEEKLAAERRAREAAEQDLADLGALERGEKFIKVVLRVVDEAGQDVRGADQESQAQKAKLEALVARTVQALNNVLSEAELAGIAIPER